MHIRKFPKIIKLLSLNIGFTSCFSFISTFTKWRNKYSGLFHAFRLFWHTQNNKNKKTPFWKYRFPFHAVHLFWHTLVSISLSRSSFIQYSHNYELMNTPCPRYRFHFHRFCFVYSQGMECFERECICEVGSRRTPDGHVCLRRWQKILGDLCEPEYDVCYHRSGQCKEIQPGIEYRGARRKVVKVLSLRSRRLGFDSRSSSHV